MLSVGREINIEAKKLNCRKCAWQGGGIGLPTGLVKIKGTEIFLYAYRCPECGSFDLFTKGKVLAFRLPLPAVPLNSLQRSADDQLKTSIHDPGETKSRWR